ncbi:DUF5943 domain-containing protein [Aquisalimonas sp.]|uniref:DUF5943 domain-containing protein n=1 Tax=Aquisalimonas sp. TaxID=1872621 RepID=UPI0025C02E61|nr:DUF5943 domain-containing protein [Aquisalimonas sp.]
MATVTRIPVEIDEASGEWRMDGLPMLLLPREDMARLQGTVAGGPAEAAWQAVARRSAHNWCATEAQRSGSDPVTVVERYLENLSQRGWGRFELLYCRPDDCGAAVRVYNSPFALVPGSEARACRTFVAWLEGAMNWACSDPDYLAIAEERCCVAGGAEACEFVIRPSVASDDD